MNYCTDKVLSQFETSKKSCFHTLDPLDPQGVRDFGQQDLGTPSVVEPDQGEGGHDLGSAILGFEGGEVSLRLGLVGEFQERATGKAANIGVGILKHPEKITQVYLIQMMGMNLMMKIEILTLDFQWNAKMIHLIPQKLSI